MKSNTIKQTEFKSSQNEQKIAKLQNKIRTLTTNVQQLSDGLANVDTGGSATKQSGNLGTSFYINAIMSRQAYHDYRPIYFVAEVGTVLKMKIQCDLVQNYTAERTMTVNFNDTLIDTKVFASSAENVVYTLETELVVTRKSNKLKFYCSTNSTLTSGSYEIRITNVKIDIIGTNVMFLTTSNEFNATTENYATYISDCRNHLQINCAKIEPNAEVDIATITHKETIGSTARIVNDCYVYRAFRPKLSDEEEFLWGLISLALYLHNSNGKQSHIYTAPNFETGFIGGRSIYKMNAWIIRPCVSNNHDMTNCFLSITLDNIVTMHKALNISREYTSTEIPALEYVAMACGMPIDDYTVNAPTCADFTDRDGNNRLIFFDTTTLETYDVKYILNLGFGADPQVYIYKTHLDVYLREYDHLRKIVLTKNATTGQYEVTKETRMEGVTMYRQGALGSYFVRRGNKIEYYPTATALAPFSTKDSYTT